jgi:superfamily II DNA helicase RecQ
MLKDEEFCLVIVPTVALGWDHLKACEDIGLSATYLGDESTKEEFEDFLSES